MNSASRAAAERLSGLSSEKRELLKRLLEEKARRARQIPRYARAGGAGLVRAPASWAQQRLWFIHELEGGSGAYHIPLALRLCGRLDPEALQHALTTLVQRHETLRTVFASADGEPWQEISTRGCLPLIVVDLTERDEAEREAELRAQVRAEAHDAFDLRRGPLIRARLVRLRPDEHVFLVTMHHIVSDGWSVAVFMRELSELYRAHRDGRGDPLPPLPIQYADYAQWQRDWLQGPSLQRQLDYWQSRLTNAAPELKLPLDRPRPAARSYRGASVAFALNANLSAGLRALAQRHDITLFMVLYAAWAILLSRLSGQDDVVIGTPVANRQRPEMERLIGFLINTLALRVEVRSDTSLKRFFEQVRETTLGAYDHQDVPFEQVVERIQPERTLNRHPLFQVMFALQNAARIELRLPGVTTAMAEDEFAYCKFDLVLSLEEQEDEIVGTLGYATDLFERDTVERWAECYEELLNSLAKGADERIADLRLLPETQSLQLASFNAAPAPYPDEKLLHELFEEQVQRTPDAVAVLCETQSLTFAELNSRANQLARHLQLQNVGPDRLVGLCVERGPEMIVGMLAIWKAGGAYVPLDPSYPADRLARMLEDAAPTVLLVQQSLQERLPPSAARSVVMDADWTTVAAECGDNLDTRSIGLRSHHLAYVIYTSGSTGRPKGVMVEHRQVTSLWQSLEHLYGACAPCRRIGVNASFTFDAAVKQLIQILSGRTLVLIPEQVRTDVCALLQLIDEQRIDGIDCTPSQLRVWLSEGLLARGSKRLRVVLVGGEAIDAELWNRLAGCAETRFYNVYGPTESTVDTTAALINGDRGAPHIGRPLENRQVYLLDKAGQLAPIGVKAEIFIGGAGVARGYLNQPESTTAHFVHDAFAGTAGARLYRTGDHGRWRRDGTLEYWGRNDSQVKIRGFRIELQEVEACLTQHPGVSEAVVLAHSEAGCEPRLVAYVVPRGAGALEAEALRAHIRTSLPECMVPSAFVMLETLPLSPNGKLDRRALPEPGTAAYPGKHYQAPQGEVEQGLAEIWRDLLRVPQVGRDDNFFVLGGHSLIGMKLIARVAERCHVRLPPVTIFKHPTVQQMAQIVERLSATKLAARGTEKSERPRRDLAPVTFSQLAHLRHFRLHGKEYADRAVRVVWSAMRLHGELRADVLRESLAEVVRRHDALRTRIRVLDGTLVQSISEACDLDLQWADLAVLPAQSREAEAERLIEQFILEPLDRATDALLAVRVLQLAHDEHILIVAMDHTISDGTSINILVRELLTACAQISAGNPVSLPTVSMQFSDHAAEQSAMAASWIAREEIYWRAHYAGCARLKFPEDGDSLAGGHVGWESVPVRIDGPLKAALNEWCRARGTTLVMGAYTAYAALVLRWCNVSDGVMQYQFNGRVSPQLDNTIGFFASPLYLRATLADSDSFLDLLHKTTDEYCDVSEHADFYYLASQTSPPGFTQNPLFNWTPLGSRLDLPGSEGVIRCTPLRIADPIRKPLAVDHEPILRLCDSEDAITGYLFFPLNRFSTASMERFARNFVVFLRALAESPGQRVKTIELVR